MNRPKNTITIQRMEGGIYDIIDDVVDKNTFYLLSFFGDNAESAEFLTQYKIIDE